MSRYTLFRANLTEADQRKIAEAHQRGSGATIDIGPPYQGDVPLYLTKQQMQKLMTAHKRQRAARLALSAAQVKYNVKHGTGPIWDWLKEHVFKPVGKFFKKDIAKPVSHFVGKDIVRPFLTGVSGNGALPPGKSGAASVNKGGIYEIHKVNLTPIQKKKLAAAFRARTPITLTVGKAHLRGDVPLKLTKTQINRLKKAEKKGSGTRITLSGKQIEHMKKDGGFIEFLMPLLENLLGGVASSALSGLAGNAFNSVLDAFNSSASGKKKKKGGAVDDALAYYGTVAGKGVDDPEGFRPSGYVNYDDWIRHEQSLGFRDPPPLKPLRGNLQYSLGNSEFQRGSSAPKRAGAGAKKKAVAVKKYNWGGALMKPLAS